MGKIETNPSDMGSVNENNQEDGNQNRVEEEKKIEIDVSSEVGGSLEEFFSTIKKKFNGSAEKLTPTKLENESTEILAPIIRDFRSRLEAGGAANPDSIIQGLIDQVIDTAKKSGSKEDFVAKVTDPANIDPSSKIAEFNKFIAKSLEKAD